MGLQDISLPVDVPWTLIATSNDMLANHDTRFPHAMWKSSLAVFKFDPDPADLPEVEEYKDRALTFLKVVCSITSYTPPCTECPPPPEPYEVGEDFGSHWEADYAAWKIADQQCQNMLHQTYPCSGALVQVAVYPIAADNTDVGKIAYFASFEPKKRELIEVATESGEAVTQSKSDVNVRKGISSTDSIEDLDVFTGANLNVGAGGVTVGAGVTGQWGTIKRSGTQHDEVTTTDAARERRESSSHTTSLSQLYHLLNSYHLGTNRAIFFIQSRPHTLQQKDRYTFIDGPQEIEGVQEFFLVLSRPKDKQIDEYCVDALLYTGHLDVDAMHKAIMEPKTLETPWFDIWVAQARTGKDTLSYGDIAGIIFSGGLSAMSDPVKYADEAANTIDQRVKEAGALWDKITGGQKAPIPSPAPAVFERYITPASLNDPNNSSLEVEPTAPTGQTNGWQIDRTRGLGGYDLWENPANVTASPLGHDLTPPGKPQAFIDVVSSKMPDDLASYHPDYALRVRTQIWASDKENAMYHGKIKAYFIRNDLPTTQRAIDMLVTVRGVSTCADSPFSDYHPDRALKFPPEIIAETQVHPPSVAPWHTPVERDTSVRDAAALVAAEATKNPTPVPTTPLNSARPSGLEPTAIGAARAKMANSIGDLVQRHLVSSLRCLPEHKRITRYDFVASDMYFNRFATTYLKLELTKLASSDDAKSGLGRFVTLHSAALGVFGSPHPIAAISRHFVSAESSAPAGALDDSKPGSDVKSKTSPALTTTRVKEVKPEVKLSPKYPLLTLASTKLSRSDRALLQKTRIRSTLDLVGLSANDLARRLGTTEIEARQLRLRILGLGSSQQVYE